MEVENNVPARPNLVLGAVVLSCTTPFCCLGYKVLFCFFLGGRVCLCDTGELGYAVDYLEEHSAQWAYKFMIRTAPAALT
jgi:hypothetical protein